MLVILECVMLIVCKGVVTGSQGMTVALVVLLVLVFEKALVLAFTITIRSLHILGGSPLKPPYSNL